MLPRQYGRIINVASIAGLSGSLDVEFIAYGTSKGAVVNFTRTLAGEWGRAASPSTRWRRASSRAR